MTDTSIHPQAYKRRSVVYRKLMEFNPRYIEINDGVMVLSIDDTDAIGQASQQLTICDLSLIPRLGFKGVGTCHWLTQQGVNVPEGVNCAVPSQDGCLVARLGMEEVLLMERIRSDDPVTKTLEKTWLAQQGKKSEPMGYPLPRQDSHACFGLAGENVSDLLAKLCAIDFRPQKFKNLSIAQASIASVSSILIRNDISETCSYLLLTDSASAEYLWDCLIDAMQEFNSQVVGCSNFESLATVLTS